MKSTEPKRTENTINVKENDKESKNADNPQTVLYV